MEEKKEENYSINHDVEILEVKRTQHLTPSALSSLSEKIANPLSCRDEENVKNSHCFLRYCGIDNVKNILTDDVMQQDFFTSMLYDASKKYKEYATMKELYVSLGKFYRAKSALKSRIDRISEIESKIKSSLENASKIIFKDNVGLFKDLVMNIQKKEIFLRTASLHLSQYVAEITDKKLLNDLRRRISQIRALRNSKVDVSADFEILGNNSMSLSWEEAFENMIEGTHLRDFVNPFSWDTLLEVAELLQNVTSVEEKFLMKEFDVPHDQQVSFRQHIKSLLPIIVIKKSPKDFFYVNIWQIDLGITMEDLKSTEDEPEKKPLEPTAASPAPVKKATAHKKLGRPTLARTFPNLVAIATEFVKANGHAAQERRRDDTSKSAGVSIADVRKHIMNEIPELGKRGVSLGAIRTLFCPPSRAAKSAENYHSYIPAKVPHKRNNVRKEHKNSHYLFARVKYRRELAQMFREHFSVISVDCMNQLRCSFNTMASRYHQINTYYLEDDEPDNYDHDFPVPRYLIKPSGILELSNKTSEDTILNYFSNLSPHEVSEIDDKVVTECVMNDMLISIEQSVDSSDNKFIKDSHGRKHFITPHSGPSYVFLRPSKLLPVNMETHNGDIAPMMKKITSDDKSAVLLISDRGPDRCQEYYANEYFYYMLWKQYKLDILIVTSFAPGYSAYNPIEHLWAPLSRSLTGVKGNPITDGDDRPPAYMAGLSTLERTQKEIGVFDREMGKVQKYWEEKTFDGWPIITQAVESNQCLRDIDTEYERVKAYFKSKKSKINPSFKDIHKNWREAMKHIDRRNCELIIKKCKISCQHCCENPVKAKELMAFVETHSIFDPQPSSSIKDSYHSFLEMTELEKDKIDPPNSHFKVNRKVDIGKCQFCPSWVFTSETEKNAHNSSFHAIEIAKVRDKKKKTLKTTTNNESIKKYPCTDASCDAVFPTYHQLNKHKKQTGHAKYKNTKLGSGKDVITKQRNILKQFLISNGDARIDNIDVNDEDNDDYTSNVEQEPGHPLGHRDVIEQDEENAPTPPNSSLSDLDRVEDVLNNFPPAPTEDDLELAVITGDVPQDIDIESILYNPQLSLEEGDYVAAVYIEDRKPYIGKVLEVDGDDVYIDFMKPNVKDNALPQILQWPGRRDDIWVKSTEVLCVVCEPEETNRGYKFIADTCQNICTRHFTWKNL